MHDSSLHGHIKKNLACSENYYIRGQKGFLELGPIRCSLFWVFRIRSSLPLDKKGKCHSNILKAYDLPNTLSATKMSGIDSIIKSIEQKLIEL